MNGWKNNKMTEKEKKEDTERYKLQEVPENFRIGVIDTKTGEMLNELDILVKITNDIDEIKKAVK